jgi:2-polyprenyl-6-methoxyphenol hydroxylase-like FAD-dependent oxidoreductase
LQQTLERELFPGTLLLDHEAVSVEPGQPEGMATVGFANGVQRMAKLVVGADGGKSILRQRVFGSTSPRPLSYVGWRALVNWVPPEWRSGMVSESWAEGCRFGIAPVGGGRTYWYATENASPGWAPAALDYKRHLLRRFSSWHKPIERLIEATPDQDILLTPICEQAPLATWRSGQVIVLGDAAHLMTPNLGQGAAMALEDAWVLAACLAEEGSMSRALRQYERRRRLRARSIVWLSRQVGRMIQLEQPALWRLRNLALRWTPDWLGELALSPVFNFRV